MKRISAFAFIVALGSTLYAQAIHVQGLVSTRAGQPVAGVLAELARQGMRDTTGADGAYSLIGPSLPVRPLPATPAECMRLDKGILEFTVAEPALLEIEVFGPGGELLEKESMPNAR
jgi:hypothetical protein